ncbi:MAG: hypothetical protein R3195_01650 [Gemmatimonadota bacterium]|nr:hypothetical protein [Gemmatimonadota bacterium]
MNRDRVTLARAARRSRRSGVARLVGCAVFSLLVAGCGLGPESDEPNLVRSVIDPPPEYIEWWRELETCSGLDGDMRRLTFFEVVQPVMFEGRQFPCGGGALCNGMWEAPHDITLAPRYVNHARLVKHEMLHDLVRTPGHPPVFEACDVTWDAGHARERLAYP